VTVVSMAAGVARRTPARSSVASVSAALMADKIVLLPTPVLESPAWTRERMLAALR
jgi:hypothetical protein